jgi:hypothetical protein
VVINNQTAYGIAHMHSTRRKACQPKGGIGRTSCGR